MVKGHKSNSQEKFCPICPQQKCSSSGKAIPCICQQHSSLQQPSPTSALVLVTTTTCPGQVREILLPAHLCQSELSSTGGSDACTVISVLSGLKFLRNEFPQPQLNATITCTDTYQNIIKDGNLYEIIDPLHLTLTSMLQMSWNASTSHWRFLQITHCSMG